MRTSLWKKKNLFQSIEIVLFLWKTILFFMKKVQKSCSLFAFFKVVTSVVLLFTFELTSFPIQTTKNFRK